ncbi:hypothetical protein ACJW30_11G190500 [Castanea mollissima]
MMGNSIEDDDDDSFTKPLGRRSVIYYGMGHMLNDITAACWFTYLLLFLTDIGLSPSLKGANKKRAYFMTERKKANKKRAHLYQILKH